MGIHKFSIHKGAKYLCLAWEGEKTCGMPHKRPLLSALWLASAMKKLQKAIQTTWVLKQRLHSAIFIITIITKNIYKLLFTPQSSHIKYILPCNPKVSKFMKMQVKHQQQILQKKKKKLLWDEQGHPFCPLLNIKGPPL